VVPGGLRENVSQVENYYFYICCYDCERS